MPAPTIRYRKLPLPSRLLVSFMNHIYAALYVVMNPLGLAPAGIAFLSGGLFGLLLLPVSVSYGLWVCFGVVLPESKQLLTTVIWVFAIPLVSWYILSMLADRSHINVDGANFEPPRTAVERAAFKFYLSVYDYFPMTCVPWSEDAKLPASRQYVFAAHPHGIHCWALAMFSSTGTPFDELFPGLCGVKLTGLAATVMFKIPVVREFFLQFGYVDARRQVAAAALAAGQSIHVCTGGEEESLWTKNGEDVVVLNKRKGFVRLALSYGADLVPVFGAGINDTFVTYSLFMGVRRWILKVFNIALPIFHGRYLTPLPCKTPIRVLIGEPIRTPVPAVRGAKPDEALVDEYHQKYIAAVKALHAKHVEDRTLRIV